MLSVDEARSRILGMIGTTGTEDVPLSEALGRCAACDLVARRALPPFANSSMDGYALRRSDVDTDLPVRLELRGEIKAGDDGGALSLDAAGGAFRIMTGAPIPIGADLVVPIELASDDEQTVEVRELPPSSYIRPAGDDVDAGEVVVEAGVALGPGELALLAAVGHPSVPVRRRPVVACVTTGDELVSTVESAGSGRIVDSNAVALRALVQEAQAEPRLIERVRDEPDEVLRVLREAASASDLIVTAGGVSVGRHDHIRQAVERGGRVDFWRVAMQPGKPLLVGTFEDTPFIGLPGNPVSVHVGFEQFVRPALRKMLGFRDLLRPLATATLTETVTKSPGRLHLVRVGLMFDDDGTLRATPTGAQGSHIQSSLVECNGLAHFPLETERIEEGEAVDVEVWGLPGRHAP